MRRTGLAQGLLIFAGVAVATAAPAPAVDAAAMVDRVDRLLRGDSSEGELTMAVVTRRWTRTLAMTVWSEGTDKASSRSPRLPRRQHGTRRSRHTPTYYRESAGQAIELWPLVVQVLQQFLDSDHDFQAWRRRTRNGPGRGPAVGLGESGREAEGDVRAR